MRNPDVRKYARIAAAVLVMLGVVFAAGTVLASRGSVASTAPVQPILRPEVIDGEAETFRLSAKALLFQNSTGEQTSKRTLQVFDSRRAFPGAPPVIPHELLEDRTMGGKSCLGCHTDGGYVPTFKAFAPMTPHPQLENCRQCHVPQKETPLFAATTWQRTASPAVNQEAMPGAPPPIPHTLQMRENCLGCHAGPGAVREIRTPHPERVNCRQCHVPTEGVGVFDRGGLR